MTATKPKRERPETVSQARTWDRNRARYREIGYCDADASRAAWGHQIGFTYTDPIGECCRGLGIPVGAGDRAERWAGAR